ncbi:GH92 family glycosyl hydrolase [Aestuariibaculum marinum]|uniref:Glycoside hydrolase family 92 protein n=1 Tax=Aestuariibaculum marinum TaxID=2683592 RepID=A0A8J6Q844_9FLAO|nr:GH92 family glycosyl hydrolase [Aestuariibaculum marinum]MBD0825183.1 glycoside hydrolase family 92 protein [Aestuariibaculum marinum]
MNKKLTIFIFLLSICYSFSSCQNHNGQEEQKNDSGKFVEKPVVFVNPFLGTAPLLDTTIIGYTPPKDWRVWAGLTFPGSSWPNAMVQLSPITEYGSGAGYEYEDKEILGFTHTNKGHWNLCNIPILPVSGFNTYPYKSKFSHTKETASPAYYQVYLEDFRVNVRLSSTLRCGIHEYTFENNENRQILFDLSKANNKVVKWEIKKIGSNALEGVQDIGRDKIYFYVTLSQEIEQLKIEENKAGDKFALVHLKDGGSSPLILKIGLSFVSVENAKENLNAEIGTKSFDEVHTEGVKEWNTLLSRIKVKGGSKREKEIFYSSLYRSFLWPALRSDSNGEFIDESGIIRKEGFNYYTLPSLWDTYRNKLVLLGMLRPELTGDVIQSMVNRGEIRGFMPTFFHGDHAAPFIASSYFKGITNFDVQKAYQLLLNNAYKEGGTRPYITEYIEKGYISTPVVKNPNVETKGRAGVSKTLEYAHDDYALSLLAEKLGDSEHAEDLMKRSENYKNVFDKETNFMRGRLDDGHWVTPFNPQYPYYQYMYREANAWQLSFYVPHDIYGLVNLYGGTQRFEEKLDSLFSVPWNSNYIARNVSGFLGQYCHGNQPNHEAPFAYYFVEKPEKSQAILDILLKDYYGIGEYGLALSGMDDAGEMSSWYVFTALGLYPLSVADNEFITTVPIFDDIIWELNNGKTLTISKKGQSRKLRSVEINGERLKNFFAPYSIFEEGGELIIETEN